MTGIVGAVDMVITRLTTLVAPGDHIFADPFAHAFVEDEVLADKLVLQSFFIDLAGIFYDTPVQLVDILETFMPEPG